MERRSVPPAEHAEANLDRYFIILWDSHLYRGERAEVSGRFTPFSKEPGMLTLRPPGRLSPHRGLSNAEAVVCTLDSAFVKAIEEELDAHPTASLREQLATRDTGLRRLIELLETEARAGGPCGRLYVESVAHAIASRFIYLARTRHPTHRAWRGGLGSARLRRVKELVHAKIGAELTLDEMAQAAGLSRAHFSHMFRLSTGESPHQFALRHKIEAAKEMLRSSNSRVLDVAIACGFKTQQHFARVFRRVNGLSPTELRREFMR